METIEKLPKHLNTAVNAIQRQIDKYHKEILKLGDKAAVINSRIDERGRDIAGLEEQIAKLKGE